MDEGRVGLSVVAYNGYLYAMGGSDGTNRESTVWVFWISSNSSNSAQYTVLCGEGVTGRAFIAIELAP